MTKTRYWRCESLVVDLPQHPNGAGGTWRLKMLTNAAGVVFVSCPECCDTNHVCGIRTQNIDSTNIVNVKCTRCGFDKQCRLTDYGK